MITIRMPIKSFIISERQLIQSTNIENHIFKRQTGTKKSYD